MMDRIFKKNVKKRLFKWKKAVSDLKDLENLTENVDRESYLAISKYGAADAIYRIIKSNIFKQRFKGFKSILSASIRHTTETAYDRSLDERL